MDPYILAVLAQRLEPAFPDAQTAIRMFLSHQDFHDMCSEYEDGVKCLRRCQEQQIPQTEAIAALIAELEREILAYLQVQSRPIG